MRVRIQKNKFICFAISFTMGILLNSCKTSCFPIFDIDANSMVLFSCDQRPIQEIIITPIDDSCYFTVNPKYQTDSIDLKEITNDLYNIKRICKTSTDIPSFSFRQSMSYRLVAFPAYDRSNTEYTLRFDSLRKLISIEMR